MENTTEEIIFNHESDELSYAVGFSSLEEMIDCADSGLNKYKEGKLDSLTEKEKVAIIVNEIQCVSNNGLKLRIVSAILKKTIENASLSLLIEEFYRNVDLEKYLNAEW